MTSDCYVIRRSRKDSSNFVDLARMPNNDFSESSGFSQRQRCAGSVLGGLCFFVNKAAMWELAICVVGYVPAGIQVSTCPNVTKDFKVTVPQQTFTDQQWLKIPWPPVSWAADSSCLSCCLHPQVKMHWKYFSHSSLHWFFIKVILAEVEIWK